MWLLSIAWHVNSLYKHLSQNFHRNLSRNDFSQAVPDKYLLELTGAVKRSLLQNVGEAVHLD